MNIIKLLMLSLLSLSGNAQLMGAQKDPSGNGCVLDGGYSWCPSLNKCVRPWIETCGDIVVPINHIMEPGPVIIHSKDCLECPPPPPCPMPYLSDIKLSNCKLTTLQDSCGCAVGCPNYDCSNNNNALSTCLVLYRNSPQMPGSFVPQCDENGDYKSMQCHGSIGSCWCSDNKGREIDNTRTMCRGNCNLNEQICDTIKDKHICNTDDDCHKDQFCRITSSVNEDTHPMMLGGRRLQLNKPISVCVDKSDEGDSCGGYTMPEYISRCKDDLECANTMGPMIADAPGTCSKSCLQNQTRNDYGKCISKIPDNCASWYDGCNTCSVNNGKPGACTLMYCFINNEAKCTSYYKNNLNINDICYRFCEDNSQPNIDNKRGCPGITKCTSSFNENSVSMIAYDSCDDRAWTCQNPYH